jgi:hypothetical protein
MSASTRRPKIFPAALFLLLAYPTAARAYLVTSTEDTLTGGTLRQAILAANAGGVPATVSFDIAGGCATPCTIQLGAPLPAITVGLTIDGYTQPGSSANTLVVGDNAVRKIVLDVNHKTGNGLTFSSTASNSLVRGLRIINFGDGIGNFGGVFIQANGVAIEGNYIFGISAYTPRATVEVSGASNVRIGGTAPFQRNVVGGVAILISSAGPGTLIQGNYVGTADGSSDLGGGAILVQTPSANVGDVTIGGTAAGAGNLIAGVIQVIASSGFTIGAITIQGNTIGLNAAGTGVLGEGSVILQAVSGGSIAPSLIGGNFASARNLISNGPQGSGHGIYAYGVSGLTIQGNYIGCNAAGNAVVGIGHWGVSIEGGTSFGGSAQIGGTGPGEGNVIAGGTEGGVRVVGTTATIEGNFIGIAPGLSVPLGNTVGVLVDSADAIIGGSAITQRNFIADNYSDGVRVDISMPAIHNAAKATVSGNSIFDNGRFGIYFFGTGQVPLPNDPGDGDTGPNGLQNYPLMTGATISGGQVFLTGDLDSTPNTLYRIEWFANTACDPSGYGEGRLPLGGSSYMTDGAGHTSFSGVMRPIPPGYTIITATATDPAGNTSEFSPCFTAVSPNTTLYTVAPCRVADTRDPAGPYGGPALAANATRSFVIAGQCGVPVGAISVAFNVAVTAPTATGNMTLFPEGATLPTVSTINYGPNRTRSNNAIVPLGPNGGVSVYTNQGSGTVELILDVTGYFQ